MSSVKQQQQELQEAQARAAAETSGKQPEPGKIVIALGRDPRNLKLKDDIDRILLNNPEFRKKYNRNRSLYLMDLIAREVKVHKKYLSVSS